MTVADHQEAAITQRLWGLFLTGDPDEDGPFPFLCRDITDPEATRLFVYETEAEAIAERDYRLGMFPEASYEIVSFSPSGNGSETP